MYEAAHRKLRRKPQLMAQILLTMDRSLILQERAIGALAARLEYLSDSCSVHAGNISYFKSLELDCNLAGIVDGVRFRCDLSSLEKRDGYRVARKTCFNVPHATEQIQWGNDLVFKSPERCLRSRRLIPRQCVSRSNARMSRF